MAGLTERQSPAVRRDEIRAAGHLAGDALGGVVGIVRGAHRSISRRVAASLPAPARPVAQASALTAEGIYAIVEAAHRTIPVVVAEVAAVTTSGTAAPSASALGKGLLPTLNGLWGDHIGRRQPHLAIRMAVRVEAADLALDQESVTRAFPEATGHLVVFLHGLFESDANWRWTEEQDPGSAADYGDLSPLEEKLNAHRSFGDLLARDLGVTPIQIRYNTGARIRLNGHALSDLLAQLVRLWPTAVERISLVGHSMGGMVAISALHAGSDAGQPWTDHVASIVTLGSPHSGAPVAKIVDVAERGLRLLPETVPYADALASRSAGIRDLERGFAASNHLPPESWGPESLVARPLSTTVKHCFVESTFTATRDHPVARLVGDGMVRSASASGRIHVEHGEVGLTTTVHLGGVGHQALMRHPTVYAKLAEWLSDEEPISQMRPVGAG